MCWTLYIKISVAFVAEIDMLTLKFMWKCKGLGIVTTKLEKKSKVGGLTLLNFKRKYKVTVVKSGAGIRIAI